MPETRIVAKLKNTTAVTTHVGTRIYPILARYTSDRPFITYQRISTTVVNGSTGESDVAFTRLQINSFANTYTAAKAVAKAVRDALGGWASSTGTPGVDMCHQVDESDLPAGPEPGRDKPVYGIAQDYLIQYPNT